VFFKCENLPARRSLQIRGAANLILSLSADALQRGVVAYSSATTPRQWRSRHKHVGARATIVMPEDAPRAKMEATRAHGAAIVTYNRHSPEVREQIAAGIFAANSAPRWCRRSTSADHGRGRARRPLELLEESGTARRADYARGRARPAFRIAQSAKAMYPRSAFSGAERKARTTRFCRSRPASASSVPHPNTIADGLRAPQPGALTFPVVRQLAEAVVLVSDDEIRQTVKFLLAAAQSAGRARAARFPPPPYCSEIAAGHWLVGSDPLWGNVDFEELAKY